MATSRRKYETEFKEQAVKLTLESDVSTANIASDLGINVGNLRRWIQEYHNTGSTEHLSNDDAAELACLLRENRKLRAERNILKRLQRYSRKIRSKV
jgi:transposase